MSLGAAVKPQHYMTFLEALKDVSGMADWALGPATGVLPPGVDGPLPSRAQGTPGSPPAEPATAVV